jgi:hypothetical protein
VSPSEGGTNGQEDSTPLAEVPDPAPEAVEVPVQVLAVGVEGTDDELASGQYGEAPEGKDQLVSVKAFEQVEVIQRRLTWQPAGAGDRRRPNRAAGRSRAGAARPGRRGVQPVGVRPEGGRDNRRRIHASGCV